MKDSFFNYENSSRFDQQKVDKTPFKIYTNQGLIISECSSMFQAIERAKALGCSWAELHGQQVGQIAKLN